MTGATIQLAPIETGIYNRLVDFAGPFGVHVFIGFAGQGEELPTLPDGSYAPCATLDMGEPYEVERWATVDDGAGQLGILDFTVLVTAGSARALTVCRDVVVTALDRWVLPGCSPIKQVDTIARTPVDSYLFPAKFAKPLGFMCVIGA